MTTSRWDNRARVFATKAHGDQKYGMGMPYFYHLHGVADNFMDDLRRSVSFLHDVVEDTKTSLHDVAVVFPARIVEAVDSMTRREDETYDHYIRRVARDEIARDVKLADLRFNLRHPGKPHLRKRYEKAIKFLEASLDAKEETR